MLFFDMRPSSETLYTSLLGVADCYFVLLTAGDRMSDLHGFGIDLEELSSITAVSGTIIKSPKRILSDKIDHKILYLIHP